MIIITKHARRRFAERGITERDVRYIIIRGERILKSRFYGTFCWFLKGILDKKHQHLRGWVIVGKFSCGEIRVITAYRTKYIKMPREIGQKKFRGGAMLRNGVIEEYFVKHTGQKIWASERR